MKKTVALHATHVGFEVCEIVRHLRQLGLDGLEGFEQKLVGQELSQISRNQAVFLGLLPDAGNISLS